MLRNTYAAIDLNNIVHNVRAVRSVLSGNTQIMAVVKADAYGHGMLEVSKTALSAGATWLAVALPEEAQPLCENGIRCPILVMGRSNAAQKKLAVSLGLRQCVSDVGEVAELAEIAREQHKTAYAHVKIDTGMGRIGIRKNEEFMQVIHQFRAQKGVLFDGLFTHFACSDDADKTFTMKQDALFREYISIARENGYSPLVHASSSAAAIDQPELNYDAIRLGISMYGYYPSRQVGREQVCLKPVMQVVTEISHIKEIEKDESVGYGATWRAGKKTLVATLPIGYGDGYSRLLSNCGRVIVVAEGKPYYAGVIGRVCMDQIMVNITGIPARYGDRVIVMGEYGGKKVDADEIATAIGTISYEVLLSYTARVPRVFV